MPRPLHDGMTVTPLGRAPAPSVGEIVAALLAVVPAHEALHVVTHPRTGDSILGVWPSRLLFYTHFRHEGGAVCPISHYHRWRCHQGLAMDCPEPRPVQSDQMGTVAEVIEDGGLYRHYERRAA